MSMHVITIELIKMMSENPEHMYVSPNGKSLFVTNPHEADSVIMFSGSFSYMTEDELNTYVQDQLSNPE